MTSTSFNRRKLMTSLTALLSALGAGTLLATSANAGKPGYRRAQA